MSKAVIIEHGGWSFEPPSNHDVTVAGSGVTLRLQGDRGASEFELDRIEETDQEVIYHLGSRLTEDPKGPYDLPEIQDVEDELKRRWRAAGGEAGALDAWADGESWHDHLTRARRMVREAEAKAQSPD